MIPTLYNGLIYSTRMTLDTIVDGVLMNNPQDVAYNLIEDMEKNHHSWGCSHEISIEAPQKWGMYEVASLTI